MLAFIKINNTNKAQDRVEFEAFVKLFTQVLYKISLTKPEFINSNRVVLLEEISKDFHQIQNIIFSCEAKMKINFRNSQKN